MMDSGNVTLGMMIASESRRFRLPSSNGFPTMRTQITLLAMVLTWGWLGIVASSGAQVVSGNRAAAAAPAANQVVEAGGTAGTAAPLTDRPEDERAVRSLAETFSRAYNAGDSKAVAALYADDAEFIEEQGDRLLGRPMIQNFYSSLFQERPGATIGISIDALRFLGADVAKEEGQTRVRPAREAAGVATPPPLLGSLRQAGAGDGCLERPRRARNGRAASTSGSRSWNGWSASGSTKAPTRPCYTPLAAGRTTRISCSAIS